MEFKNKAAIAVGMVLLAGVSTRAAAPINQLTPAEKRAGWILLFDGVNLKTHWKVGETGTDNSWDPTKDWNLNDSSLHDNPALESYLFTKDIYTDFEFSSDWKTGPAGNSGIFFRVTSPPGWFCSGPEYAILDDATGGDRSEISKNVADRLPNGQMAYIKRTGADYDMYPTTKNGAIGGQFYDSTIFLPVPKWNHSVIWANGNFIEHWLNDQKVVDYEVGSTDWEARFANSKFYTQCSAQRATWAKNKSGFLGLQGHGANLDVWFRNLKVRPFTSGDTLVSPLATPNGGDFSGTVKVGLEVAITGAAIHYTIDGSTPTETSPLYTDSLVISATTTVKAVTTRAKFKNSSVSTAVFSKAGSSVFSRDLSPNPEVAISTMKNGLILRNKNGQTFSGEIRSLSGKVVASFASDEGGGYQTVSGLKQGLFLVKIQRGNWTQMQKVVVQ